MLTAITVGQNKKQHDKMQFTSHFHNIRSENDLFQKLHGGVP